MLDDLGGADAKEEYFQGWDAAIDGAISGLEKNKRRGYLMEGQNQKTQELLKLIQENPDLPVIPFVNADVVADNYGDWMGSWGGAQVDEYIITDDDWPVLYKSADNVFGALEKCLTSEEFEALPEDEDGCRPAYNALPWKKAIIVYINLPEE